MRSTQNTTIDAVPQSSGVGMTPPPMNGVGMTPPPLGAPGSTPPPMNGVGMAPPPMGGVGMASPANNGDTASRKTTRNQAKGRAKKGLVHRPLLVNKSYLLKSIAMYNPM